MWLTVLHTTSVQSQVLVLFQGGARGQCHWLLCWPAESPSGENHVLPLTANTYIRVYIHIIILKMCYDLRLHNKINKKKVSLSHLRSQKKTSRCSLWCLWNYISIEWSQFEECTIQLEHKIPSTQGWHMINPQHSMAVNLLFNVQV